MGPQLVAGGADFSAQLAGDLDGAVDIFNVTSHVPQNFAAIGAARAAARTDRRGKFLPKVGRCRALPLLPGSFGLQFQLVQVFVVEVDGV